MTNLPYIDAYALQVVKEEYNQIRQQLQDKQRVKAWELGTNLKLWYIINGFDCFEFTPK